MTLLCYFHQPAFSLVTVELYLIIQEWPSSGQDDGWGDFCFAGQNGAASRLHLRHELDTEDTWEDFQAPKDVTVNSFTASTSDNTGRVLPLLPEDLFSIGVSPAAAEIREQHPARHVDDKILSNGAISDQEVTADDGEKVRVSASTEAADIAHTDELGSDAWGLFVQPAPAAELLLADHLGAGTKIGHVPAAMATAAGELIVVPAETQILQQEYLASVASLTANDCSRGELAVPGLNPDGYAVATATPQASQALSSLAAGPLPADLFSEPSTTAVPVPDPVHDVSDTGAGEAASNSESPSQACAEHICGGLAGGRRDCHAEADAYDLGHTPGVPATDNDWPSDFDASQEAPLQASCGQQPAPADHHVARDEDVEDDEWEDFADVGTTEQMGPGDHAAQGLLVGCAAAECEPADSMTCAAQSVDTGSRGAPVAATSAIPAELFRVAAAPGACEHADVADAAAECAPMPAVPPDPPADTSRSPTATSNHPGGNFGGTGTAQPRHSHDVYEAPGEATTTACADDDAWEAFTSTATVLHAGGTSSPSGLVDGPVAAAALGARDMRSVTTADAAQASTLATAASADDSWGDFAGEHAVSPTEPVAQPAGVLPGVVDAWGDDWVAFLGDDASKGCVQAGSATSGERPSMFCSAEAPSPALPQDLFAREPAEQAPVPQQVPEVADCAAPYAASADEATPAVAPNPPAISTGTLLSNGADKSPTRDEHHCLSSKVSQFNGCVDADADSTNPKLKPCVDRVQDFVARTCECQPADPVECDIHADTGRASDPASPCRAQSGCHQDRQGEVDSTGVPPLWHVGLLPGSKDAWAPSRLRGKPPLPQHEVLVPAPATPGGSDRGVSQRQRTPGAGNSNWADLMSADASPGKAVSGGRTTIEVAAHARALPPPIAGEWSDFSVADDASAVPQVPLASGSEASDWQDMLDAYASCSGSNVGSPVHSAVPGLRCAGAGGCGTPGTPRSAVAGPLELRPPSDDEEPPGEAVVRAVSDAAAAVLATSPSQATAVPPGQHGNMGATDTGDAPRMFARLLTLSVQRMATKMEGEVLPRATSAGSIPQASIRQHLAEKCIGMLQMANSAAQVGFSEGLQPWAIIAGVPGPFWVTVSTVRRLAKHMLHHCGGLLRPQSFASAGTFPAGEGGLSDMHIHSTPAAQIPGIGGDRLVLYMSSILTIRKAAAESRRLKQILEAFKLPFEEVDLAAVPHRRPRMLKAAGDMPDLPQLHCCGRFIGTASACFELHDFGELIPMLHASLGDEGGCRAGGDALEDGGDSSGPLPLPPDVLQKLEDAAEADPLARCLVHVPVDEEERLVYDGAGGCGLCALTGLPCTGWRTDMLALPWRVEGCGSKVAVIIDDAELNTGPRLPVIVAAANLWLSLVDETQQS